MKLNSLVFRKFVYLIFYAALCCFVYSSTAGIALGQKKPGSLNQGTTSDDKKLCAKGNNNASEFCGFYNTYIANMDSNPEVARKARNRMIDLVQWQIEIYYKERKDNRKTLVARLQMIFDILEIGSAAAAGIIKGTLRAKTVIAQALSGFQAGRSAGNKNFEILQTQILINTMNANRADISTGIESSKKLNVDEYTWYKAKEDLTDLLNAGTFSDALDTLVKKSGADAERAEALLRAVTKKDVTGARSANDILVSLDTALKNPATEPAAASTLRGIATRLAVDPDIGPLLAAKGVTATSTGRAIWDALFELRGDLAILGNRTNLIVRINQAIVETP
jgi:hypothetical protein